MAELETQIRSLADRRFAATEPVSFTPDDGREVSSAPRPMPGPQPIDGTEIIMRSNETVQPPRSRWYLLGAAAGVAALAVVGVALLNRDGDPAPPAATDAPVTAPPTLPPVESMTIVLTGADGDAAALEAFEPIVDAFEAFNRGDGMGWATARNAPGPPPADGDDPEVEYVAAAHAAGARYDVTACEYEGFGSRRGVEGHRFICDTKLVDAFTTAAGLDHDEQFDWVVADGRVIDAVSGHDDTTILQTFMDGLRFWIEREHPDTHYTAINFYRYPLADEMPAVLELVDEFVSSRDGWPLSDE